MNRVGGATPRGSKVLVGLIGLEVAVAQVGLANVRHHLYGATAATWDDARRRAGTSSAALDAALDAALAR